MKRLVGQCDWAQQAKAKLYCLLQNGGSSVKALDLRTRGREFKPRHCKIDNYTLLTEKPNGYCCQLSI